MKKKNIFISLVFINILVLLLTYFFKLNHLYATLFCFGIPFLYLAFNGLYKVKEILIFSLLATLLWGPAFDIITTYNGFWTTEKSTLGLTLFGLSPVENWIWMFLIICFAVSFYQIFIDKSRSKFKFRRESLFLIGLLTLFSFATFTIFKLSPESLLFSGAYVLIGITNLFIPNLIYYLLNKRVAVKALPVTLYFFTYFIIYEYVALSNGNWIYGDNFFGFLTLGVISIPFEEILFWMICAVPLSIACYELLIDDNK